MILLSDSERRRAFSIWLRTGKLPSIATANGVELKFNPWHDPADGRFTFAGSGQNYGQSRSGGIRGGGGGSFGGGGDSSREAWSRDSRPDTNRQRPRATPTPTAKASGPPPRPSLPKSNAQRPISQNGRGGGGFTGGGGGSFGGAGASSTEPWGDDLPMPRTGSRAPATATSRQAPVPATPSAQYSSAARPLRREVRNGYEYQIDETGRTRRVSGTLKLAEKQVRSKRAQAQAGGADRRPADDGGHYIAARFNGPTDAFNHFAQNANFNRGEYRLLEDQWARAKRAGRGVTVKIVPIYDGASKRPSVINIWFTTNGHEESVQIPNEPKEKRRGK